MPGGEVGSQRYLEDRHGLSAPHLAAQLEAALSAAPR
jgi:hypothetical protein